MSVIYRLLSSLTILLFSICGAVTSVIFLSSTIYSLSIDWFNLQAISGLSQEELMVNYNVILEYLVNPSINELSMPFFSMSEGGAIHFEEVKVLFFINFIILIVLFLLTIWVIRVIKKNNWQLLMVPHFSFKLAFPLILLFFIVVAFDQVFYVFHQLLFNNDLWLFNPIEDPVITVLPQEFFMILFILALLIYEALILAIRAIVYWDK